MRHSPLVQRLRFDPLKRGAVITSPCPSQGSAIHRLNAIATQEVESRDRVFTPLCPETSLDSDSDDMGFGHQVMHDTLGADDV